MKRLDAYWDTINPVSLILSPLSFLFCAVAWLRRWLFSVGLLRQTQLPVPVIVVGNISVGGTGKTPLVIWLTDQLKQLGYTPGIVSRGYGGKADSWPQPVSNDSDPDWIGDEPCLLAQRTGCPMWVGPDRVAAAQALLEHDKCDLIISDDGLQHYRLARSLEIVVVDGVRRFGNGLCLPAGPLRERPGRLNDADWVIVNGGSPDTDQNHMDLQPGELVNLSDGRHQSVASLSATTVHAFAGIGHPKRFFDTLRQQGLDVIEHPFPDHHRFIADDFKGVDGVPVIMTEKDAVKCNAFASPNMWVLSVDAMPDKDFQQTLTERLRGLMNG